MSEISMKMENPQEKENLMNAWKNTCIGKTDFSNKNLIKLQKLEISNKFPVRGYPHMTSCWTEN